MSKIGQRIERPERALGMGQEPAEYDAALNQWRRRESNYPRFCLKNADFWRSDKKRHAGRHAKRQKCPSGPRLGSDSGPLAQAAGAYQVGGPGAGADRRVKPIVPAAPVKQRSGRPTCTTLGAKLPSGGATCGTGVGRRGPMVLTSPNGRKQEAAGLQFARGQTVPVPSQRVGVTQEKLRGGLEAISRDPRLVEHVTLNIAGHRLRFSVWRLGLAAVE
jgi:hypothetical protein